LAHIDLENIMTDPIIYLPTSGTPFGTDESGNSCYFLPNFQVEHYCPEYPEGTITQVASWTSAFVVVGTTTWVV